MINIKHYHVVSGLHGYMPDRNNVSKTKRGAIEDLRWLATDIVSTCEPDTHKGKCYSGRIKSAYLEVLPIHGLEYAEITICDIPDCLLEIE